MVFGNDLGIRSANITPLSVYGIGKWTYEDFELAVTQGIRPDGKALRAPMNKMRLDSIELKAIWAYLRTVPRLPGAWPYESRMQDPGD